MKREDLKNLGIEKELQEKIFTMYGNSINKKNAEMEKISQESNLLKSQIEELQKAQVNLENFVPKEEMEKIKNETLKNIEEIKNNYEKSIQEKEFNYFLETTVNKYKAKDSEDVITILKSKQIKDKEQVEMYLDKLAKEKTYLFDTNVEETNSSKKTTNSNKTSFDESLDKYFN